ncbi:MAG: glycosyltransferase [Rhodobacteraceae bacterium]|nr:glycosyltransferase [Paracoccaceae bacterium]
MKQALFRAFNMVGRLAASGSQWAEPNPKGSVYSFRPRGAERGRILLAHRLDGVLLPPGHPRLREHNQFQEVVALIETLLERGYAVDAVSNRRRHPTPRRDYDLFLSVRGCFDALGERLDPACIKVLHIDTTHWLYNNHASLGRSLEVLQARGVTPERDIEIERNRAIETADYALMPGNDFVYDTFAFAGTPVFEIVNPAIALGPWPKTKNHDACRRRFLWLGSRGLAHKGLGRTLEAFAGLSDHHLTVCGPLGDEPAFFEAYRRELRQCPNIRAQGWIDLTGQPFDDLAGATLALILPSCAEAQAGAVINCMAAGMIPMVSRQVGMDVDPEFGVLLEDDTPRGIREAARALADRPAGELRDMARRAWEIAHERHSIERYKTLVGDILERILRGHPKLGVSGFVRLSDGAAPVAPTMPARQALRAY